MDIAGRIFTTSNLKVLGGVSGCGVLWGILAATFSEKPTETANFVLYEYIPYNQDVMDTLSEIKRLLLINGSIPSGDFEDLCVAINILIGYDILIDRGVHIPLDMNYTLLDINTRCDALLHRLLKTRFRLSHIGLRICELVELIEQTMKDIVFNMRQELQVRIMDSRF